MLRRLVNLFKCMQESQLKNKTHSSLAEGKQKGFAFLAGFARARMRIAALKLVQFFYAFKQLNDKVLGVDPEIGELVEVEVTATDTDEVKFKDEYTIWYLSDGTKIKTVNKHRFYNVREKKMMFMEEWQIGDEFVKEDGTKVKLEKKRTIHRRVRHFTLNTTTETYFANGMLSGNYHTKPMASETFKFMK